MSLRYLICFWLLNLTEARRDDGGLRFSFPETRRGRSTPTIGPTKSIKNAIDTQSNSQDDFLNKIPNEEQLIFNAFQSLTNPIESGKYNSLIPRKNEQYEKFDSNFLDQVERDANFDSSDDNIRCIPRVIQVEEVIFDTSIKCTHSYSEKCHMTFVTDYQTVAQNKCETNFKKNCQISFKPVPSEETVRVCYMPLVQECSNDTTLGPEICRTLHEISCETRYNSFDAEEDKPVCVEKKERKCTGSSDGMASTISPDSETGQAESTESPTQESQTECEEVAVRKCTLQTQIVKKVQPNTACKNIPKEVCLPNNCHMIPGEEICNDDVRVHVQNLPQEECDIQPEEVCHMETVLVPRLVSRPNCLKVPKETCFNVKGNPRKVKKPIVKEWCYKPSDLANS